MTKLAEWLFFVSAFTSVWLYLVTKQINHSIIHEYYTFILYFPFIILFLFFVYAGSVVLWRVYAFNDCHEAALELKEQIAEAKTDLKRKGFKFEYIS